MELLFILLLVGLLDVAALRWGADSRDGYDWRRPTPVGQAWWDPFWDRSLGTSDPYDQRAAWRACSR